MNSPKTPIRGPPPKIAEVIPAHTEEDLVIEEIAQKYPFQTVSAPYELVNISLDSIPTQHGDLDQVPAPGTATKKAAGRRGRPNSSLAIALQCPQCPYTGLGKELLVAHLHSHAEESLSMDQLVAVLSRLVFLLPIRRPEQELAPQGPEYISSPEFENQVRGNIMF